MLADGSEAPEFVTIQVPGFSDVVKVPFLDTAALRGERVMRWKAAVSPVPEFLQWIPDWINWLDDAQDLLFVTLVAGRPLLRRLPAAFLPWLGWILLANDALNLGVTILATLQGTRFPKKTARDIVRNIRRGRAGRLTAASAFLSSKFPWLPFAIQGGQVLYNYTGYGLQLGVIMGGVTDSVWSLYRRAQGTDVRIVGPPPSDPVSKAGRYLSQSWLAPYVAPFLSEEEVKLVVGAEAAAMSWLYDPLGLAQKGQQLETYGNMGFPGFGVWSDESRDALLGEGYSEAELDERPSWYDAFIPDMFSATRQAIAHDSNLDSTLAEKLPPTSESAAVQTLYEGAVTDIWDVYAETLDAIDPLETPWERLLARTYHENSFPPWDVPACPKTLIPQPPTVREQQCRVMYLQEVVGGPIADPWRFPRVYPPAFADHGYQLMWWLQLALVLLCDGLLFGPAAGASGKFPQILMLAPIPVHKFSYGLLRDSQGRAIGMPLRTASVLVWGNIWARDLSNLPLELPPRHRIPMCIPDVQPATQYLTGVHEEPVEFREIRTAVPIWPAMLDLFEADARGIGTVLWDGTKAVDPTTPQAQ